MKNETNDLGSPESRDALEYAESIINTIREPLILLDHNLTILSASRSFFQFFKVSPGETIGKHIYSLGNHQWDIPKLRELLNKILPEKMVFDDYEVAHDFPGIGKRILLLNARQVQRAAGKERIILLAIEDVTKRRAAEKLLEELAKRKSSFVADVSHELSNPLAVIKEALVLTLEGMFGETNPKQKEILKIGKRSIERLIRLVRDLLSLSKIESGKMELKKTEINMPALVEEVLVAYGREISKKQLVLEKNIQKEIGLIWGDHDKLTEAVINLLNNAVKYTAAGTISISLSGSEKEIRFEIADTGSGVPPEYQDKIFDKFERIKAEKQEGTGLGLSIVKEIIELHKGKIWVESESGKGSKFIFTLPRGANDQ